MRIVIPLLAVLLCMLVVFVGVGTASLDVVFGVVIPVLAAITFVAGFIYRIITWAKTPVPFRITTTCGQQKSLPWIKQSKLDCPSSTLGVIGRMALEVLLFRSLFRNSSAIIGKDQKVVYLSDKLLWAAGLAFHWAFLVVFLRHLRFFLEPVPRLVSLVEGLDSFFQVGLPIIYISDIFLVAAVTFLFLRRVVLPQIRYISLPADYFPLFVILAIAGTGIWMRYFAKVDTVGVKELTAGLASFHPTVPEGLGVVFYIHLCLFSVLLAYFPFSKLMHMGGVFLSPTRNMANDNRMRRHVNPWDYPVKVHPYDEYEEEFREKMVDAEIPLDKES